MTDVIKVATEEAQIDVPSYLPRPLRWLDRLEEILSVVLLVVVLVAVSTQVIARYVFQAPLFWGDELARYSYVWMAFMAAAFISGRKAHVIVGVLDNVLSPKHLRWLESFAQLVVAIICFALVIYSYDWLLKTARPKSSALRVPMIWLYGGVWLAFALMAFHSLVNFYYVVTGKADTAHPLDENFD
jgi:TRAP-type C4-dicarboxylate transport system permease small subunit